MPAESDDIELKFDGAPVEAMNGAPAELVARSLIALQRMAYLIGMKREGQRVAVRARPSAKVRRSYAIVCKHPQTGSHVQPFDLASSSGQHTAAASAARTELLSALRAIDSGDDALIHKSIPDPRQRWFLADAAEGLLPDESSGINVSVRQGHGRFAFKADRARRSIKRLSSGNPPVAEAEDFVGRVKAIDFSNAFLVLKPNYGRQMRASYPLQAEGFLTANKRKRLRLTGVPTLSGAGDPTGFSELSEISEVEPSQARIEKFVSGASSVSARRPYAYLVKFDIESRHFIVRDDEIGLDVFSSSYEIVDQDVRADLDILWRTYAEASDESLTDDALRLKRNLRAKFERQANAS